MDEHKFLNGTIVRPIQTNAGKTNPRNYYSIKILHVKILLFLVFDFGYTVPIVAVSVQTHTNL